MVEHRTALEVAAGRGHPDNPLLDPRYVTDSRVPCGDFTPWIAERLTAGDVDAVATWVARVVGVAPRPGTAAADAVDRDRPPARPGRWLRYYLRRTAEVVGATDQHLVGLDDQARTDLQTALVVCLSRDPLDYFALPAEDLGRYLAAAMAPHDVRLADAPKVAANAARWITRRRAERIGAWERLPFPDVDDLTPSTGSGQWSGPVAQLSVASRAHLAFLATDSRMNRVQPERVFQPWWAVRSRGLDTPEAVQRLLNTGLVAVADTYEQRRAFAERSITVKELRELLAQAGVSHPKSANKTRLLALADGAAPGHVDALADGVRLLQMTDHGHAVCDWLDARVADTSMMWRAWVAMIPPEPDPLVL